MVMWTWNSSNHNLCMLNPKQTTKALPYNKYSPNHNKINSNHHRDWKITYTNKQKQTNIFFFKFLVFWLFIFFYTFFFWTITTKIIMHPHTCLLATTIHFPKQKDIRSHYHRLANISKQRWDGMGEQRKRLMSDQFKRAS